MWHMFVWKCIISTNTTNNVWEKRYRVYIRFFSNNGYNEREHFRIFAFDLVLFLYDMYVPRCGTVYRDCVVNSTRNIAKSTNDIHVCEKNNSGFVSLPNATHMHDENANLGRMCACVYVCVRACSPGIYSTNKWYGSKHDLQWFAKHREQPSIKYTGNRIFLSPFETLCYSSQAG